jgi:uncharacterized protein YbbC (DUF1343 family)
MARCFPGTVLLEGTTLSEGRGTTTALELAGAPDVDFELILERMKNLAPEWLDGCILRLCHFETTFHKHVGKMCSGIQIHTDNTHYRHGLFKPYRLIALLLKVIRLEYPNYELWREFAYEYETQRLAIDLLTGGTFLREWVDDSISKPYDFEDRLLKDEKQWSRLRMPFLLY